MSIDILICAVPWIESARPVLAPAVLKSAISQAGYRAKTLDLAFHVWKKLQKNPHRGDIITFFQTQEISNNVVDTIAELIEECAEMILQFRARIVGLSLLSQDSQVFNWVFTWRVVQRISRQPRMVASAYFSASAEKPEIL